MKPKTESKSKPSNEKAQLIAKIVVAMNPANAKQRATIVQSLQGLSRDQLRAELKQHKGIIAEETPKAKPAPVVTPTPTPEPEFEEVVVQQAEPGNPGEPLPQVYEVSTYLMAGEYMFRGFTTDPEYVYPGCEGKTHLEPVSVENMLLVQKANPGYDKLLVRNPVPTPVPHPLPLPPPMVIPKSEPPPAEIDLVKDGKGKRYVSKTAPDSKYHLRDRSEAEKPVGIVRNFCNANPTMERKQVILACIGLGVNKNTAATQYSLWKAAKAKEVADAARKAAGETVDEDDGGDE